MVARMTKRSNAIWCEIAVTLTLASFKARIFFVYYINTATASNNTVGTVAALEGLE